MRNLIIAVAVCLGLCSPAYAAGFFDVIYAAKVEQTGIPSLNLDDAVGYGILFGYDTELFDSGVFLDIELGYEMSTHDISGAPSDYFYRSHRGMLGVRIKYGGLKYARPFLGFGVIPYGYYEASDEAATAGALDYEIEKNLSGSYIVFGVDFFFAADGSFSLGLEQRTLNFDCVDTDTGASKADVETTRTAFRLSVLF